MNRFDQSPGILHPRFDPQYITMTEIAQRLGRPLNSVQLSMRRRSFPFAPKVITTAGQYFNREEVEAWLDDGAPRKDGTKRIGPDAQQWKVAALWNEPECCAHCGQPLPRTRKTYGS
jgi:hypothetical protein